ncbi:unnamed protein product [Meganyctiphanes norvegica]|uniref:cyclin-dependent kinase n=1 Tax=Meganyctiphanes norvegica TaxID=48144 RepID=A0AAV2RXR3_MEGNR
MTMASAGLEPQDVRVAGPPGDGDHPQPHGTEGTNSQAATQSGTVGPFTEAGVCHAESPQVQSSVILPSANMSRVHTEAISMDSTIGEVKGSPNDSTSKLTHSVEVITSPCLEVTSSQQVIAAFPRVGGVLSPAVHVVSAFPQAEASPSGVSSPLVTRDSNVPQTGGHIPVGVTLSTTPAGRDPCPSTSRVSPTGSPSRGGASHARSSPYSPGLPEPMPTLDHMKQQPLYEELNEIGNGAYGTVYRARDLVHAGRVVALKKIRISLTEEGVPVFAIREIATLKQLERFNHPNIVRLLDICQGRIENDRLTLMLVFEYMDQDLDKYLKRCPSPGLEPNRIKSLIHQVIEGVDFLHSNRVIHRDLKPQNILVNHAGRVKIADFGLARIYDFNMRLTTTVVTLWYRAPEVLLSNSYATPVDVWSCGCIFAELFRRRPIFEGRTEGDQLQIIFDVIGTPLENEWPRDVSLLRSNFRYHAPKPLQDVVPEITSDAADLMQKMLKFKPDCRISALEAKNHPYFDSLRASSSGITAGSSSSSSSSSQIPGPVSNIPLSPIRSPVPSNLVPLGLRSPGRALNFPPNKGSLTPGKVPVLSPRPTANPTPAVAQAPGGNDENNPNAGNSAASSSSGPTVPSKPIVTAVVATTSTAVTAVTPTATVPGTSGTTGGTANR